MSWFPQRHTVLKVSLLYFASLCSWSVRFVQGSFLWLGDLCCFYLNKQTSLTHKYLLVFITNGILFPSALQILILILFVLLCHFTERIRNLSMGWREWSRNLSPVFALVSSWESKTRLTVGFSSPRVVFTWKNERESLAEEEKQCWYKLSKTNKGQRP